MSQTIYDELKTLYRLDLDDILVNMFRVREPKAQPYEADNNSQTDKCHYSECKEIGSTYPYFCDTHGPIVFEMHIKESTISGAGLGLFTAIDLSKGDFIALYSGDLLSPEEYKARYPNPAESAYCISQTIQPRFNTSGKVIACQCKNRQNPQLNKNLVEIYIDARGTQSCLGRYANDAHNSEFTNNAEFADFQGGKFAHTIIQASCDIAAGSEIFVNYGPKYWDKFTVLAWLNASGK